MSNPLELFLKTLSPDMFTVIKLSLEASPEGLDIKCSGSKPAKDCFIEMFGEEKFREIRTEIETAAQKINNIIRTGKHQVISIDLLELKRQAKAMDNNTSNGERAI